MKVKQATYQSSAVRVPPTTTWRKYFSRYIFTQGPVLTSPLLLGIMYVSAKPDSSFSAPPDLTHGARMRTVCPLTGYIALSSTPPKNLAPSPTATITASGGEPSLENRPVPPSIMSLMCCTDPRRMRPPFARNRVKR